MGGTAISAYDALRRSSAEAAGGAGGYSVYGAAGNQQSRLMGAQGQDSFNGGMMMLTTSSAAAAALDPHAVTRQSAVTQNMLSHAHEGPRKKNSLLSGISQWYTGIVTTLGCTATRHRPVINQDGTASSLRRQFKKGGRSMLCLCAFQLPSVVIFFFFLVLYLMTQSTLDDVVTLSAFTALANLRFAFAVANSLATFTYIGTQGYAAELDFAYSNANKAAFMVELLQETLTFGHLTSDPAEFHLTDTEAAEAVSTAAAAMTDIKGSEMSGIPGLPSDVFALINEAMFAHGCPLITTSNPTMTLEHCEVYNDGILEHGLHDTLVDFNRRVRRMRERRRGAALPFNQTDGMGVLTTTQAGVQVQEWYSVHEEYASLDWSTLDVLRLQVLLPSFSHIGQVSW